MGYKMEKDVLIQYYQQRKSTRDIAQLTGKSQKNSYVLDEKIRNKY